MLVIKIDNSDKLRTLLQLCFPFFVNSLFKIWFPFRQNRKDHQFLLEFTKTYHTQREWKEINSFLYFCYRQKLETKICTCVAPSYAWCCLAIYIHIVQGHFTTTTKVLVTAKQPCVIWVKEKHCFMKSMPILWSSTIKSPPQFMGYTVCGITVFPT